MPETELMQELRREHDELVASEQRVKDLKEYIKVLEKAIDGSIGMAEIYHEYLDYGKDLKEVRKKLELP